jgi:hypothetical protein
MLPSQIIDSEAQPNIDLFQKQIFCKTSCWQASLIGREAIREADQQ